MDERFIRTRMIMGENAVERLARAHVAVFGVGGVGGYVVEALVRSGVGHIEIVDNDKVCLSNINRQIIAAESSLGRYKVDAAKERILDINPDIEVTVHRCFYLPDGKSLNEQGEVVSKSPNGQGEVVNKSLNEQGKVVNKSLNEQGKVSDKSRIEQGEITDKSQLEQGNASDKSQCNGSEIDFTRFDYVVDAVDTVTAKLGIICESKRLGIPVISIMGCGNRLDPTKLKVADIYETRNDPLSRIMRKELKKRGITSLKTVFSTEEAIKPDAEAADQERLLDQMPQEDVKEKEYQSRRRSTPGSAIFVPAAAGLIAAGEVCRELAGISL